MDTRPLALHLPDADSLTPAEIAAVLELKPAALLVMCYAQWDSDRKDDRAGVSEQTVDLVGSLGHDRLYVRFHADPNPVAYARSIGGPEAWGRLCASRMGQYYGVLAGAGVQLHAILTNEHDASNEGGLDAVEASFFLEAALNGYESIRPDDILHVPATSGSPDTHRAYLERYRDEGWVKPSSWIDGHGYDGDFQNVIDVLAEVFPENNRVVTETNDLHDFGWPIAMIDQGKVNDVAYFILNWARGGEGRVQPPTPDDEAKQMSLMRFPDRYRQFMDMPLEAKAPNPQPEPTPEPEPETPVIETVRGVDVASYQGFPDWESVAAAGYKFAFTKSTEDTGYVNPSFAYNWERIKAAGMIRGAYHFARPGGTDARDEATFFLDLIDSVGGLEDGDIIALDIESGNGDMGRWAVDFLQACEERCGVRPLVYTGRWFMAGRSFDEPELADHGLWFAAYQSEMPSPPPPWDTIAFWQYSSSGHVPGIDGDVDMNVFNGTLDRLSLYGKPGSDQPMPEPMPEESPFLLGPGIRDKMAELGDRPASGELYLSDDVSEAMGESGTLYRYVKAVNRVFVFRPI